MPASHPLISPAALFVDTATAATMLHIAPRTVRDLVTRGHLHAFHPVAGGRKYLLYTSEVQAYAKTQRGDTDAAALANVRALMASLPPQRGDRHKKSRAR